MFIAHLISYGVQVFIQGCVGAESVTFCPGIHLEGLMEAKTCCTLSPAAARPARRGEVQAARRGGQLMHSRPEAGEECTLPGHCPLPAPEARTTEHAHVACVQPHLMF